MKKIRNSGQQAIGDRRQPAGNSIGRYLSLISSLMLPAACRLLPVAYCLIFSNCQEPSKGCLDAKATNFDVTATQSCVDNCCTYPNLSLQTTYISEDVSKAVFKFENKYKIGLDSIQIIEGQFYLSDFQLVTPENKNVIVIDSSRLYRQKDTVWALNNYALVGRNNGFDFKIGSFNQSGKFSKLRFKMGLNTEINKTDPAKMPASHPLSTQRDSMYLSAEKTYIFNRLAVVKWQNQGKKDTMRFFITAAKDIEIIKNMSFTEGFNVAIPLTVNYLKFIDGVNFSNDANTIKQKIVSNYDKVFSIN
jgi:hypothetical protein